MLRNKKTAVSLDFTGFTTVFLLSNCQRWEYMDGIETLGHIRSMGGKFETLPVIALTANVMTGARERYINAGFTDFLEKPIKPSKLDEMLFAYLPKEKLEHKSDD